MIFHEARVRRLLRQSLETLEQMWDENPYDEILVCAVTIKQFMADHDVADIDEGLRRFAAFKEEQSQKLADVGLGNQISACLAGRLASQAA